MRRDKDKQPAAEGPKKETEMPDGMTPIPQILKRIAAGERRAERLRDVIANPGTRSDAAIRFTKAELEFTEAGLVALRWYRTAAEADPFLALDELRESAEELLSYHENIPPGALDAQRRYMSADARAEAILSAMGDEG